jgi:hypothetical protein
LFDLDLRAGEEACCHAAVMIVATALGDTPPLFRWRFCEPPPFADHALT